MPVLDTNFLIALARADAGAKRLLESIARQPLRVPSVVAAEFLAPYGAQRAEVLRNLERSFEIVHTGPAWVEAAARQRHELARSKASIRSVDFWIATWAFLHDDAVVTRNVADFQALGAPTMTW
jgi:predicted nucleic acid-binding protein